MRFCTTPPPPFIWWKWPRPALPGFSLTGGLLPLITMPVYRGCTTRSWACWRCAPSWRWLLGLCLSLYAMAGRASLAVRWRSSRVCQRPLRVSLSFFSFSVLISFGSLLTMVFLSRAQEARNTSPGRFRRRRRRRWASLKFSGGWWCVSYFIHSVSRLTVPDETEDVWDGDSTYMEILAREVFLLLFLYLSCILCLIL